MEISCQNIEEKIILIHLDGRLDAATGPDLKAILKQYVEEGFRKIIVDLQKVPFIDSSGLVALVSGLRLARAERGDIVLSGMRPQVQTVFRLTMLDRIFPIHPTYNDAKRSII